MSKFFKNRTINSNLVNSFAAVALSCLTAVAASGFEKYRREKTANSVEKFSAGIRLAIDTSEFNKRRAEGRLPIFYYRDGYENLYYNRDKKIVFSAQKSPDGRGRISLKDNGTYEIYKGDGIKIGDKFVNFSPLVGLFNPVSAYVCVTKPDTTNSQCLPFYSFPRESQIRKDINIILGIK